MYCNEAVFRKINCGLQTINIIFLLSLSYPNGKDERVDVVVLIPLLVVTGSLPLPLHTAVTEPISYQVLTVIKTTLYIPRHLLIGGKLRDNTDHPFDHFSVTFTEGSHQARYLRTKPVLDLDRA